MHGRSRCSSPPVPTAPVGGQNGVTKVDSPARPLVLAAVQDASSIDWEKVPYVVLDLETTGSSRWRDEIIELAAVVLDHSGVRMENAVLLPFVIAATAIPLFITKLRYIN